jgi:nicotinamide mononucleotide transporter
MDFFSIKHIFFTVWDYPVSYLEFAGMVSGLIAVYFSARANVLSWPIGIINVSLSFFLFYQVQLYPDMFLQSFFFATNVLGWWRWLNPFPGEEDRKNELRVSWLNKTGVIVILASAIVGTFAIGKFAQNLHVVAPLFFSVPSAFPYADSFILVMSVVTTFYMIQKKVESWIIWIVVDILATYLYYSRGLMLYALLYFIFCFLAAYGLFFWIKEYRSYKSVAG